MQAERIDEPRPAAATTQTTTAQVFTLPTAPAQRYRQWCELAERQRSGQPIEPDAAQWFEVYPKSKEFAAQQRQA